MYYNMYSSLRVRRYGYFVGFVDQAKTDRSREGISVTG
jgi:hypothetical protein